MPPGKTEGQVLRALQGHKMVAGGNAPGKGHARSPDPGGVVFPWAVGRKTGVTSRAFDPFRVGPCRGAFSGGVAPGYCMDPLRGSRMDRSEDVLGAPKASKTPSGPLGLSYSIETSNSSSFWRTQRSAAKNLALDFSAEKHRAMPSVS